MNSHSEIQKRLAAYCSGDINAGERTEIEAHLVSCLRCRSDLADLKTTLRLIRSVPEVEAPSWMKSRIMAHLREEQATKKSWLQRFRFPLHTGFPVKALALMIVCVSGYYLSRSVDTELQLSKQQQLQEIPAQQAPVTAPSTAQPPADPDKEKQPGAVRPLKAAPTETAQQPVLRQENIPGKALPQVQSTAAHGDYAPAPPALKDQSAGKAESMNAAPAAEFSNRVLETMPELKQMKKSRSLERSSDAAAPAAAGRAAGTPPGLAAPQFLVRLNVNDPANAPALIREAVIRSGGSITEERVPAGQRLTARIPAARQSELLERLQQIGRIVEHPAASTAGTHLIELTIQW
jgi:anti-sigma factor RsiW